MFRAWRSKSSFATSMSRSLSCNVRFASRRLVISFSSALCAEFASALDSLYFLYARSVCWLRPTAVTIESPYLPFFHLKSQSFGLLLQHPFPLVSSIQILLELSLQFFARSLEFRQLMLQQLIIGLIPPQRIFGASCGAGRRRWWFGHLGVFRRWFVVLRDLSCDTSCQNPGCGTNAYQAVSVSQQGEQQDKSNIIGRKKVEMK